MAAGRFDRYARPHAQGSAALRLIDEFAGSVDVERFRDEPPAGHLGLLKQAAQRRGLEVQPMGRGFLAIEHTRVVGGVLNLHPSSTSIIAARICRSKRLSLSLLRSAGLPVPVGKAFDVDDPASAEAFAQELGWPLVVKPSDLRAGSGVSVGLRSESELRAAWRRAEALMTDALDRRILVERQHVGLDVRAFVVGQRIAAVAARVPAYVRGDGRRSIRQLVGEKNEQRARHPYLRRSPITLDAEVDRHLTQQQFTLDVAPDRGSTVLLRQSCNVSLGGEPFDLTERLGPRIAALAVSAVEVIPGLDIAGVDMIVDDLGDPTRSVILEVNAAANMTMHHYPVAGEPRDVAGAVIDRLKQWHGGRGQPG